MVSPANSFGFMDGGVDAVYLDRFGMQVQDRLRRLILEHHHGELLVGSAEIVETGDPSLPYLIAAPTMRVPMVLPETTVNPYLATRAALLAVRHNAFRAGPHAGARISDHVRTLAFPGMGTGVGRVLAPVCARQMRAAHDAACARPALPKSWADASVDHQLLYCDRPVRLQ